MKIEISYQTWEDPTVVTLSLSPEEYYDPLGPGETFEANGAPKHNHTVQYLSLPASSLKWTCERRSGTRSDTTLCTQYSDRGRTWMNHRLDPNGYEAIIHCTQLTDRSYHVIRTFKYPGGRWAVYLNTLVNTQEDG